MAKKSGQDRAQVRWEVRCQLMLTRLAEKVTEGVSVTDKDVSTYYESNPQLSIAPALSHLLLLVVESRGKAEDLRQQSLKDEDFGSVVRQHSKVGYKESGGDMGWVDPRVLPPPVTAAVEAVRDIGVTIVVETPNRFLVIRVEGRQPSRRLPLAEMKDHLARTLLMEQKRAMFTEGLGERPPTAEIKTYL